MRCWAGSVAYSSIGPLVRKQALFIEIEPRILETLRKYIYSLRIISARRQQDTKEISVSRSARIRMLA